MALNNDAFDSLEAIVYTIASIRTHPVLPPALASPPQTRLMRMAEDFAGTVNMTRDKDFARMLESAEGDPALVAQSEDHVVDQAICSILDTLSKLRERECFRENAFTTRDGKNSLGLFLNPVFRQVFDICRAAVPDDHDFRHYLDSLLPPDAPDFHDQLCKSHAARTPQHPRTLQLTSGNACARSESCTTARTPSTSVSLGSPPSPRNTRVGRPTVRGYSYMAGEIDTNGSPAL